MRALELAGLAPGSVMLLERWAAHTHIFRADKEKLISGEAAAAEAAEKAAARAAAREEGGGSDGDEDGDDYEGGEGAAAGGLVSPRNPRLRLLPRYLCLARERLLVLAAHPSRVGVAVVKSNHHVSELAKLTYSKKEPQRITLWRRRRQPADAADDSEAAASGEQLVERSYRLEAAPEFRNLLVAAIGRL